MRATVAALAALSEHGGTCRGRALPASAASLKLAIRRVPPQ
jgi:hypothetical protein